MECDSVLDSRGMSPDDRIFLRDFFRRISDQPLDPRDKRYVPLYDDPELTEGDPVELLARSIEWTSESVQLFSGYRGTGKSTELRRLRQRLEQYDHLVFLCDVEDYLNLSAPVDISDFLMAVAGVFGDSVNARLKCDRHPLHESYWERFRHFLTQTQVEVSELSTSLGMDGAAVVEIRTSLKSDPSFKQRLQEHMAGRLGAFVSDVHAFLGECVKSLRKYYGSDRAVVLLLDSVEHIRGTSANAEVVHSSVETLFASHADKLRLPYLHVIYTVPPYLKVRYSNIGSLYQPGGLQLLPAFKLHGQDGKRLEESFDAMERVVSARGDWRRLLGEDRSPLDRLIHYSGGHLRDLLRLLAEILRRASVLPVPKDAVNAAIDQLRTEYLPIADDEALWLAEIAQSHQIGLKRAADLPALARFFDTHLALCYRNGEEWYDVHPLVSEHVIDQAKRARSSNVRS